MSGEPSPKRQRTEEPVEDAATAPTPEETAKIQKVLNQVADVEVELENENDKQAREILKIETKYNKAKAPTFAKRSKLLRGIPQFWKQAVRSHMIALAVCVDAALCEPEPQSLMRLCASR